jgi:hypothetical protein
MKMLIGSAVLCVLISPPAFGQPRQQEQQQQDERAKQQDEKAKQQQEEKAKTDKQQQQSTKEQEKQQKQVEKQQKDQQKQERKEEPSRAVDQGRGEQGKPAAQANGGERTLHGGARIPDDRFRAHFGRQHHFHIGIRAGERRFQYGGYYFEFVDAWPAGWSYSDDFYIDYIGDDYYLCDVEHPEVQLVVIVVQ